ncbi:MAG: hypothetical protein QM811_02785 [Pirellulales bacterium]
MGGWRYWPGCRVLRAAIVNVAYYPLGESGSMGVNNLPQDVVGGHHFLNSNGTNNLFTIGTAGPPSGSTAYAIDGVAGGGYFSTDTGTTTLPTNTDWVASLWVRASNTAQSNIDILSGNGGLAGAFKFTLTGGAWGATLQGGPTFGSQTAVANTWARLTAMRYGNALRFYVDGTLVGSTTTASTTANFAQNGIHLGVNSGGSTGFVGNLDELKLWTFNSGTDSQASVEAAVFGAVPEPSSWCIVGGLASSACIVDIVRAPTGT